MKQLIDQVEAENGLCIGVTGHRTNRLSSRDCTALQGRLTALFASLDATLDGPVTLWSGMAEGTDAIAAAARPAGWTLRMVLTDTAPNWLDRLERTHPLSAQIFAAACVGPDAEIRQVVSYRALGAEIVAHVGLLVAVWDGAPGLPGGTGEVVAAARAKPMPVLHIPFPLDGSERLL